MQVYTSRTVTSFQDNAATYDAHRQPLPAHVQGHPHVGAVGVQAGAVIVGVHVPVTVRTIGQGHYQVSFSKFVIFLYSGGEGLHDSTYCMNLYFF